MASGAGSDSPAVPMTGLTLLIGGARSGKSALAVQFGQRSSGGVTFIATATRLDDDMSDRIARHRADRPPWPTIEAPLELRTALGTVPDGQLAIIDCLTMWVSNALLAEWPDEQLCEQSLLAAAAAATRRGPTVAVTNEVGLGIHPETDLGRRYRDLLGRVNRQWADLATQSLFLVAGRAIPLHDPWALLT